MPDPYGHAASAYRRGGQTTLDHRSLEASALLRAASRLDAVRRGWQVHASDDLDAALIYNRKLWTIFASEAADGGDRLPDDLRTSIANLSLFVFRRSMELQAQPDPGKIEALVEINRTVAAGLLARPAQAATSPGEAPHPPASIATA